jgi:SWI/SNF-related matrix-associated actin-dependent regulator of chromatin subfamily A-like protein 1
MTEPLYRFQIEAAARIMLGEQIYLGFDPGLGKSRTAIEAAAARGASRTLIVCPASGRYVWRAEIAKWKPGSRVVMVYKPADLKTEADFYILTYSLISKADSILPNAIANGPAFDFTVLDEAAALKNPGANRTKRVLEKMLPKLGYALPMSGTPAPNHAGELYPILKALYPKALKGSNGHPLAQWQFEDRYCRVTLKRFGNGPSVRVIEGSRNLPELRTRIDKFMVRVRKMDVLKDLPPVRYDIVPLDVSVPTSVNLPPDLSDDDVLRYLAGKVGDEHIMRLRRMLGLCKAEPAVEYLDDFLSNLPDGRKILVFAHHREVVEKLLKGLANWSPAVITGASTPNERTSQVNKFLTNRASRVFIGNIQAAGTGLTLVGPTCPCSDVFFVEASYSVGDNVQAAARVHRIGQREAVVARFLTAHKTIDDRIQSILARKALDFKNLFE